MTQPHLLWNASSNHEATRHYQPLQTSNQGPAHQARIFSLIAHDLRNLLQPLHGYSELLARELNTGAVSPAEANDLARHIHHASESILHLLDTLLAWSRKSTFYHPEQANLHHLAVSTLNLLGRHAAAKHITVRNTIPAGLTAYGDKNMLAAILRNLVANALKFTPIGGQVCLCASQSGQPGWVWVEVADTGTGITPETVANIFNRSEPHTCHGTTGETGSGLGLLLCREMVEQHAGQIWVEASKPGHGSRIRFTVPQFNNVGED